MLDKDRRLWFGDAAQFPSHKESSSQSISICARSPSPSSHGERQRSRWLLHTQWGALQERRLELQFSSVTQSCLTLCNPMDCSTPGLPVHHQLPEFTQTHVHLVSEAIQPSHPLSAPSPATFSLSQHQGLFKWVSSLHQMAKVLEFQLQHQSFQWTFRTDFL